MKVNFEYLGEDREVPGSKMFKVEAIHVGTTRNKRKFTKEELEIAARSLSFRPLNINHDDSKTLPFNEGGFLMNTTLDMHFESKQNAVIGKIRVSDSDTIHRIESKDINTVSIEQMPTRGESCDMVSCEQHGVAFIGLALLEKEVAPGDPRAKIHTESIDSNPITELIVPQAQRECTECTDFVKCTKCSHHSEADECMERCLSAKKAKGITIDDQAIAICLSECGKSKEEQWTLYEKYKPN